MRLINADELLFDIARLKTDGLIDASIFATIKGEIDSSKTVQIDIEQVVTDINSGKFTYDMLDKRIFYISPRMDTKYGTVVRNDDEID